MDDPSVEVDGQELRRWRQMRVYGQSELAKLAGVSRETVAKIESGERKRCYPATVRKLAEVLGVEPIELLKYRSAIELRPIGR
jgi:transcriptional regulator with XRE-family HTH domain